jgi:DNA-binding LytR/AlgR family response regulator
MPMIRCVAVDDEKLALDLLEDNIRKVPFLELLARCNSGAEALAVLHAQPADLLFLDIHMPDISGIQLLKGLRLNPMVILTTAFSDYAREGFDLDVIDYLVKPYSFERFLKAVSKAREYHDLRSRPLPAPQASEPSPLNDFIFVRAGYRLVKINFSDIQYVEGLKDYVKIYINDKPVITQMSMKSLEEKLPAQQFVRVHRSFIVAFNKIDFIQRQMVSIGKKEIPVSDHYRDQLYKIIHYEKLSDPGHNQSDAGDTELL